MERQTPASPGPRRDDRSKQPGSPETPEERLDEALTETFPTSDPVSISVPEKERDWTPEELEEAERKRKGA